MITISNLTKKYGDKYALDNISFNVKKGEVLGFLGPNGAGKSTTMNIITGYISYTDGSVNIDGYDILENPIEVKKKIGYLPEIPPLYLDMVVWDYLEFVYELKKIKTEDEKSHIQQVIDMVKIDNVKNRKIANLSKGYRQRVGLAGALIGEPEILILDEPTVGLDPKQIIEIRNGDNKKMLFRISGDREKAENILNSFDGISNVTCVSSENDSYDFEFDNAMAAEEKKKMFFAFAENEIPILMQKEIEPSLEDIFLKLTDNTSEKEENTNESDI